VKGSEDDCPTGHGEHLPTCDDVNPTLQYWQLVKLLVSVCPGPHSVQAPPAAELWPTTHCTHVPLTSCQPALQLQWLQPTPLHELTLQGLHAATPPPENVLVAHSTHPDFASLTRWPTGHVAVHVSVRVASPWVWVAQAAHAVSAVLPHGGRKFPCPHEAVVHKVHFSACSHMTACKLVSPSHLRSSQFSSFHLPTARICRQFSPPFGVPGSVLA